MIKELIFSGKKYYEGKMPYYVGKNFKSPTSPVTKYTTNTEEANYITLTNESLIPKGPIVAQAEGKVEGETKGGVEVEGKNEVFLMGGTLFNYYWVTLRELLQNGGVSSSLLLSHIYQWLRRVFTSRNEVRACL